MVYTQGLIRAQVVGDLSGRRGARIPAVRQGSSLWISTPQANGDLQRGEVSANLSAGLIEANQHLAACPWHIWVAAGVPDIGVASRQGQHLWPSCSNQNRHPAGA